MKRTYEPASKRDGFRVLVDRLWPRGIKKQDLVLDAWMKELAPSQALRKEFNHDPKLWKAFQIKYKKELKAPLAQEKIMELAAKAKKGQVTLLYSAKDEEHNDAVVLKKIIEEHLRPTR